MGVAPRPNEIYLNDTHFPIVGQVEKGTVSKLAEKIVFGAYDKDSELEVDSWVIEDQRAGIGIKDMKEEVDLRRCWWSTLNLDHVGHLILGPLATDCGNPGSSTPAVTIEYDNEQWTAFGSAMHKWNDSTSSWGSSLQTLTSTPTDAIVQGDYLFVACTTDYERWNTGGSWTTGTTLNGSAQPAKYFEVFDQKLWRVDTNGNLYSSLDYGATWSTRVSGNPFADGEVTALFKYRDASGDMRIYLGTKDGLYIYNHVDGTWLEMELGLPRHTYSGKGAKIWRDSLYYPAGLGIYEYRAGNPSHIQGVGLDRDYGLPSDYRGNIIDLLAGHNYLYALVDATEYPDALDTYCNMDTWDTMIEDYQGLSVVFQYNGIGWSVVAVSGSSDGPVSCGSVSTAYGSYRLWYAKDDTMYYVSLLTDLINPLEVGTYTFQASGSHETPWFDANQATIDKIGLRVHVEVTDATATEYVKVYYQLNHDESSWTLLTSTTYSDGQIDADGEATFVLGSSLGIAYRSIRFKIELARGSTTTLSPDVRWLRFVYRLKPDTKYGYKVTVNCRKRWRNLSASQLVTKLFEAKNESTLVELTYDKDGDTTDYVDVSDIHGQEIVKKRGGTSGSRGLYEVIMVAP